MTLRRIVGLRMSEALARCPVPAGEDGEAAREALVEAFGAIEAGALAGVHDGPMPKEGDE